MKALKTENLTVSIAGNKIVESASIEIKQGELHVLMGPNGSGKSTLIFGIMKHPAYNVSGNIFLGSEEITHLSTDQISRKGVSALFQSPIDLPGIRLRHLLWNSSKHRFKSSKDFSQRVEELLSLLSLEKSILEREITGFSGGERKRIELLSALLLDPQFLLVDEVDSGLDVDSLKSVASILKSLKKNKGILIITHYTRILEYLDVDAVYLYDKGKILKQGGIELAGKINDSGFEPIINGNS
ncbi:MAG TPA: Fe-S cluster assembly ATPase SufC [Candidatus Woesearchaeota archaeon]|nr:Fe-S cluster assembly ATPase SufC [Candidatus Woesearchaeota archaeon]